MFGGRRHRINLLIIGTASYRGVEYLDSTTLCGTTCHVMLPENTAYHVSPHAHVACMDCHIGPGLPWMVRAKLTGLRQVYMVATHTYPRPTPSPVKTSVRPAKPANNINSHAVSLATNCWFAPATQKMKTTHRQTDIVMLKAGGRIDGHHLADAARLRYVSTDPQW
jgi:hypothetical protein